MKKWKISLITGILSTLLLSFGLYAQDEEYLQNHPEISSLMERYYVSNYHEIEFYKAVDFPEDQFYTLTIAVPQMLKIMPIPDYYGHAAVGIIKTTDSTVTLFRMSYDFPLTGAPAEMRISWIEEVTFDQLEVKDITGFSITIDSDSTGENGNIQIGVEHESTKVSFYSLISRNNIKMSYLGTYELQASGKAIIKSFAVYNNQWWIAGTGGVARLLTVTDSNQISEEIRDISSGETVMCYGDGFIGTSSGTIYRFDSTNGFVDEVQLCSDTLRYISNMFACGSNGAFLKHQGQHEWVYKKSGDTTYHMGHFPISFNSPHALLVDKKWQVHKVSYYKLDLPTYLASTGPDSLETYINNSCLVYNGNDDLQARMHTGDREGNNSPPVLCVKRANTTHHFTINLNPFHSLKDPRLSSNFCDLFFINKMFVYEIPAESSYQYWNSILNTVSTAYASVNRTDTFSLENGDTVTYRITKDSIRFACVFPTGNTVKAINLSTKKVKIDVTPSFIRCTNPHLEFSHIDIYSLQGKFIARYRFNRRKVLIITNNLSPQLYLFRFVKGRNSLLLHKQLIMR